MAPEFDYNWTVRISSLRSWIGYLTLAVGAANFMCSIGYVYIYFLYKDVVVKNGQSEVSCEMAAQWTIFCYCAFIQAAPGTLCCVIYILCSALKTCHAVGFICPLITTKIKKNCLRIPTNFGHYQDEFDFECDESQI